MSEAMVRASGGFSQANLDAKYNEGYGKGETDTKVGNATLNDVLDGKTFTNSDAVGVAGRMPNNGNYNIQLLERNQVATIPTGYHSGNGTVSVKAPTARKTLTAGQTGVTSLAPYDYADVDASAVYAAGRADWQNHANRSTVYYQEWDDEEGGWSVDQTMTVSKAGIVMILIDAIKFTSTSGYTPGLTGISITGGTILYSSTISDEHKPQSSAPERAYGETYRCYVRMAAAGNIRLMFRLGRRCSGTWLADLIAI